VASFIGDSNLLDGIVAEVGPDVAIMDHKGVRLVVRRNEAVPAVGAPLCISLRPERVRVARDLEGCDNRVTVRVRNVTYKGGIIDYELLLPSEDTVVAQVQAGTASVFPEGTEVDVGWTKEACVAVRPE
jgi:ABC-type Fe3+/spermidine/putrescine transport system ATPase subunit